MRYAVIGVGALGGFYGGLLARSGLDVHFLARSDFEHLQSHGLRVDSVRGNFHLPTIHAYSLPTRMPVCDVVVVALKSTENSQLATILPPILGDQSIVVVLQNGLGVEQAASDVVGPGRVLGGCCFLCSNKIGPGHIRHLDYGRIALGSFRGLDEQGPRVDESKIQTLVDDWSRSGIEVDIVPNLTEARWRKLMWNIPFNGLSVALHASTHQLMHSTFGRELVHGLMSEVRSIANAMDGKIEESFIAKLMNDTLNMAPYDSSMRIDFQLGRPMEIHSIFDGPLEMATQLDVPVPRLRFLTQQLRFMENSRR